MGTPWNLPTWRTGPCLKSLNHTPYANHNLLSLHVACSTKPDIRFLALLGPSYFFHIHQAPTVFLLLSIQLRSPSPSWQPPSCQYFQLLCSSYSPGKVFTLDELSVCCRYAYNQAAELSKDKSYSRREWFHHG